jgi:hypothetical protein
VIYRRQYDALGSPVGSTPVLTLTAKVNPAASLTSVPFPDKINVVPQRHDLHPIGVVALCTATPGTGVSFDNASVFLMRGDVATKAEFLGTNKISVTGRAGTFQCSVSVADTDGSPASECDYLIPCGNPDKADSYPPIGTVSLTLNNTPVPNVRCRLDNKMGTPEPPTKQAIGQAPFVSSCKLPAVTIERPPPGGLTLRVEYNKAWIPPPRTLDPAHDRGSYAIPIVAATPP